jgi:hypothetical protein
MHLALCLCYRLFVVGLLGLNYLQRLVPKKLSLLSPSLLKSEDIVDAVMRVL